MQFISSGQIAVQPSLLADHRMTAAHVAACHRLGICLFFPPENLQTLVE
ncbi:hypothetical protein CA13_11080 [Planctomycetes bacterium CA13]|uniref:Uncharacterized protein n=1 Tax=Novipirellula herctigrandis TaxID=2527986 RepID=A0A5C5YYN1_9BACT|nr:hypothetical protein CA13_11080 [Planctomycetes bacterium CA13]